ncbi:MAG: SUMF1/EgtB/PvdO family nonheme iron enzyme, partial [Myxococcota bacterium]
DCYVPAGWCRVGGDPLAPGGLPARRVWVDGFVIRRFVVTNAEYLAFVNALPGELAERYAPRDRGRDPGTWGEVLYGRDADGRYGLRTDADGDTWLPDWPVIMVDHVAAWAYARWRAEVTGLPWRLPGELEWEKAARGTDGRIYPWGDALDPSWYGNRLAFAGAPQVEPVTARPLDESPYGVRGMAGQVVEWTADRMSVDGPCADGGRVVVPDGSADGEDAWADRRALHRIVARGGSRTHDLKAARCAFRLVADPWTRSSNFGFRIARAWG